MGDELSGKGGKERWPAVDQAYDFVIPSYEWMHRHLAEVHGHIQALQAFAATVMVAGPVLATSVVQDIDYESKWFILALVVAVAVVIVGMVVRALGALQLPSPKNHYEKWLTTDSWEFKKNAIYFAGEHMEANTNLINRKAWLALLMMLGLLAQIGLFVTWILTER